MLGREVSQMCLARPQKLCNFLEWREYKIIYKRYASLFFITCGMEFLTDFLSQYTVRAKTACMHLHSDIDAVVTCKASCFEIHALCFATLFLIFLRTICAHTECSKLSSITLRSYSLVSTDTCPNRCTLPKFLSRGKHGSD
jgi:hypothetical protein